MNGIEEKNELKVFLIIYIQTLCLRSNLIQHITNLDNLTKLTNLELYDNILDSINGIEMLSNLVY